MDESVICVEDSIDVIDLSETLADPPQNLTEQLRAEESKKDKPRMRRSKRQKRKVQPEAIIDLSNEPDLDVSDDSVAEQDDEKGSSQMCCPICFEKLLEVSVKATVCGHVFCSACIEATVKEKRNCPNCRKKITLKDLIPLYL